MALNRNNRQKARSAFFGNNSGLETSKYSEGSRLLFQVISDSYETRSVVYTTNIEFSGWGRVLGDKNMAAALIDRTVHHGRLAGFEGGSYRSEHALMTR